LEGRFGIFLVKWFGTCEIVWLGKFHRFETFGCEFSKRTAVMASQLIFFEEVNVNSRLPSKYKRSLLNVPNTIPLLLLLWSNFEQGEPMEMG